MGRLSLPRLATDRLRLEPAGPEHRDLLLGLNADAEVMRFLHGRAATVSETDAEWAERLDVRTDVRRGLGYWVGFHGGRFAGWWSASSFATDPAISGIGYRLARSAWGRGYATEGARAMVEQAFADPAVEHVVASTMAVNHRSRRVLEKLAMSHVDSYVGAWKEPIKGWEQGEVAYALARKDWSAAQS